MTISVAFVLLAVGLSMVEFQIGAVHCGVSLLLFCMMAGSVFCNICPTSEELMSRIWPGGVVVTDRTVDVHITRIRSKIAPYGRNIVSRSGYGYGWHEA